MRLVDRPSIVMPSAGHAVRTLDAMIAGEKIITEILCPRQIVSRRSLANLVLRFQCTNLHRRAPDPHVHHNIQRRVD